MYLLAYACQHQRSRNASNRVQEIEEKSPRRLEWWKACLAPPVTRAGSRPRGYVKFVSAGQLVRYLDWLVSKIELFQPRIKKTISALAKDAPAYLNDIEGIKEQQHTSYECSSSLLLQVMHSAEATIRLLVSLALRSDLEIEINTYLADFLCQDEEWRRGVLVAAVGPSGFRHGLVAVMDACIGIIIYLLHAALLAAYRYSKGHCY